METDTDMLEEVQRLQTLAAFTTHPEALGEIQSAILQLGRRIQARNGHAPRLWPPSGEQSSTWD